LVVERIKQQTCEIVEQKKQTKKYKYQIMGSHNRYLNITTNFELIFMNILFAGGETNKNVSSKDYYAYHLMIRRGQDNVILRCRELCQQFTVDMYVKIESEQLQY